MKAGVGRSPSPAQSPITSGIAKPMRQTSTIGLSSSSVIRVRTGTWHLLGSDPPEPSHAAIRGSTRHLLPLPPGGGEGGGEVGDSEVPRSAPPPVTGPDHTRLS